MIFKFLPALKSFNSLRRKLGFPEGKKDGSVYIPGQGGNS